MDEAAFHQVRSGVVARPCPFERAILRACAACALVERKQIAERELISCADAIGHARCQEFYGRLKQSFSFALGKPKIDAPLPHAQEMQVQCGGLKGLQQSLSGVAEVANVDQLLRQACEQWGGTDDFPYSQVVHAAASVYKGRHG